MLEEAESKDKKRKAKLKANRDKYGEEDRTKQFDEVALAGNPRVGVDDIAGVEADDLDHDVRDLLDVEELDRGYSPA